jgi:lantibiotic modifying enzyme
MRQYISVLFQVLLFFSSISFAQNGKDYLSASEKIASWLSAQEHYIDINQSAWPVSNINKNYPTGMDEGTNGIGTFYLELYKATKNNSYLAKAIKAANYTYEYSKKYGTNGPDWIGGAAGSGDFLVSLYMETKDTSLLNKAKYFGDYLISTAYTESGGYYWKHGPTFPKIYTGFAHGAAGIGYFFLNLYKATLDYSYLDAAEKALTWLKQYYIRFDDYSIGWKRLTYDDFVYHQWCGGSVGIMIFLDKLYEITKSAEYLDLLKETANGFLLNAVAKSSKSCAWQYTNTGGSFPVIYCHGTSSLAASLFLVYKRTNEQKYLDAGIKGMNWIDEVKIKYNPSRFYWDHIDGMQQYDTGLLTGTAGVGKAFLECYQIYNAERYKELAVSAADYLLSVAETPNQGQLRWINYTSPENINYDAKQYYTGWYSGAAGIGIFFIDLYNALPKEPETVNQPEIVTDYKLYQNYPNPFNPQTTIRYEIPKDGNVKIKVYDIFGRETATLTNEFKKSGTYQLQLKANDYNLSTGIYYYRLNSGSQSIIKKMVVMK